MGILVAVPISIPASIFFHKLCVPCTVQVIGVTDVDRSKEKGYETIVKEGFCDEVGHTSCSNLWVYYLPCIGFGIFFLYGFMSVILFV